MNNDKNNETETTVERMVLERLSEKFEQPGTQTQWQELFKYSCMLRPIVNLMLF